MHATVLALTLTGGGCVPDRPERTARPEGQPRSGVEGVLGALPCGAALLRTVSQWRGGPDFLAAPVGADGARVLRVHTDEPGRWLVVEARSEGATVAVVDAGGATSRVFDPRCGYRERRVVGQPAAGGAFTDRDLIEALREAGDRPVIVYAWSPHMPLSVDGFAEVRAAGEAFSADVLPVLIAHGDSGFAGREAERVGIPTEGLREIASVELVMRDAQVHAPSILVFSRGAVSPVLPGYRNADGYRRFIRAFLD